MPVTVLQHLDQRGDSGGIVIVPERARGGAPHEHTAIPEPVDERRHAVVAAAIAEGVGHFHAYHFVVVLHRVDERRLGAFVAQFSQRAGG